MLLCRELRLGAANASRAQELDDKKQIKLVEKLHNLGCSIRQIVRLTGLTKAKVERMLRA